MKQVYKFRVGIRALAGKEKLKEKNITHAAILVGTDLFEYGTNSKAMLASSIKYGSDIITLAPNLRLSAKAIADILKESTTWIFSEDGYRRISNYNRHKQGEPFDWDEVGQALNGQTYVSPDELEKKIKESHQWTDGKYDIFTHNCHDFVKFCMEALGCPKTMTNKIFPCYRKQN